MTDYANPPFHCFARGSVNTGLGLPMTHGDSLGVCRNPLERKPESPAVMDEAKACEVIQPGRWGHLTLRKDGAINPHSPPVQSLLNGRCRRQAQP